MKALQKRQTGELAPINLMDMAGKGAEDITSHDLPKPFLKLLQKMSVQVDVDHESYVEGARPGMIYNTGTGVLYDHKQKSVVFVPVMYQNRVIEWRPKREGFVAEHLPGSKITRDATMKAMVTQDGHTKDIWTAANGNILVDTAIYHGFLVREDGYDEVVISMSSTAWQCAKQWNLTMTQLRERDQKTGKEFRPPIFSRAYNLMSKQKENEKGAFHIWQVELNSRLDYENNPFHNRLLVESLDYIERIEKGEIRAEHDENGAF